MRFYDISMTVNESLIVVIRQTHEDLQREVGVARIRALALNTTNDYLTDQNNQLTQTERILRSRISQLENENEQLRTHQLPDNNFAADFFAQLDEPIENHQNGHDHDDIEEFD